MDTILIRGPGTWTQYLSEDLEQGHNTYTRTWNMDTILKRGPGTWTQSLYEDLEHGHNTYTRTWNMDTKPM